MMCDNRYIFTSKFKLRVTNAIPNAHIPVTLNK